MYLHLYINCRAKVAPALGRNSLALTTQPLFAYVLFKVLTSSLFHSDLLFSLSSSTLHPSRRVIIDIIIVLVALL